MPRYDVERWLLNQDHLDGGQYFIMERHSRTIVRAPTKKNLTVQVRAPTKKNLTVQPFWPLELLDNIVLSKFG